MASVKSQDTDKTKRCLLEMLATVPVEPAICPATLDRQQWSSLQLIARQHRLEPLLHQRFREARNLGSDAQEAQAGWAAAFRNSAIQGLASQSTLVRTDTLLSKAGIAYASLKGARLVWHAYPHPALRPMRDLDILVAPGCLLDAYQALTEDGFSSSADNRVPVDFALTHHKHLPGLLDPATGIYVELHSRIFEHQSPESSKSVLLRSDELLASRVWLPLGGVPIAYLPATETLMHLIVHSAHEHRFDNGPQILNDICALLGSAEIDWQHFWAMASEGGWERSCQLLFGLTEKYHGAQPIDWTGGPGEPVPDTVLDDAAMMMLQDFEQRGDLPIQLFLAAGGADTGRFRIRKRLMPARHIVADYAGKPADHPLVWLYYPLWLASRLKRTWRGMINPAQRAEVARAIRVEGWLS
jgi:Uncharacterised nucleotidyltransferase